MKAAGYVCLGVAGALGCLTGLVFGILARQADLRVYNRLETVPCYCDGCFYETAWSDSTSTMIPYTITICTCRAPQSPTVLSEVVETAISLAPHSIDCYWDPKVPENIWLDDSMSGAYQGVDSNNIAIAFTTVGLFVFLITLLCGCCHLPKSRKPATTPTVLVAPPTIIAA